MISRIRVLLTAGCAVALVACGDFTAVKATRQVFSASVGLFSLNTAPIGAPNALSIGSATTTRADASFGYDMAFQLDTVSPIRLIPLRLIASTLAGSHRVGFQKSATDYDSLFLAPVDGYKYDTTFAARPGATTLISVENPSVCFGSLKGSTYYAKMIIDSVDVQRKIYLRLTVDPNCGFRGLLAGEIPRD